MTRLMVTLLTLMSVDLRTDYVFSPWWDPTVKVVSNAVPQIHQKLLDIRKSIGGLKAEMKSGGPRFAVKSSKDLIIKVRDALDKTGCHAMMVKCDAKYIETESGTAAEARVVMRVCAPDGSYVDFEGYGQGVATDDKAGGKAVTYAQKCAWVYGLQLPDAEMKDTDDEEGLAPVRKGTKAAKSFEVAIEQAATKAELEALLPALKLLPQNKQVELGAAYKARMAVVP